MNLLLELPGLPLEPGDVVLVVLDEQVDGVAVATGGLDSLLDLEPHSVELLLPLVEVGEGGIDVRQFLLRDLVSGNDGRIVAGRDARPGLLQALPDPVHLAPAPVGPLLALGAY